jgi:uncharacterized protein YdeI (YjbR/CyaY-like superfamily)
VRRPTRDEVQIFEGRDAFRRWMDEHHATDDALFVGYYRKGVPRACMTYDQSVEVGLAYGWIDSITYRVDDEVRAIRFTPRRNGSNWSALNVRRMRALIGAGAAHPAGVAAFDARHADRTGVYSYENAPADLPGAYLARLRANAAAAAWWDAQSPSYRRAATWWVVSAKREETRERRLEQLIVDSAAGRQARPFRYGTSEP